MGFKRGIALKRAKFYYIYHILVLVSSAFPKYYEYRAL